MQDSWIFVVLAFLVGVLAGLGIAALQRRLARNDTTDVEMLREEFEDYREDVTAHFVETAELVNHLTQSYKAVYDHLEVGAYRLVGEERLHRELKAVDAEPVTLEYLGPRKGPAHEENATSPVTEPQVGGEPEEDDDDSPTERTP